MDEKYVRHEKGRDPQSFHLNFIFFLLDLSLCVRPCFLLCLFGFLLGLQASLLCLSICLRSCFLFDALLQHMDAASVS